MSFLVYVNVWMAKGRLDAWLSDSSATALSDQTLDLAGEAQGFYTLTYTATSSGQLLYVKWTPTADYDNGNGEVGLGSAALVGSGGGDTVAPTVSITAPAAGAQLKGSVSVSANASDNVGIVGVTFKLDGVTIPGSTEDTTAPYSVTWDTTSASDGNHTLSAMARDAAGNVATSTPISIIVSNSSPDLGYYWYMMSSVTQDTNKTAASWINDGDTVTIVGLPSHGGSTTYQAIGLMLGNAVVTITSVDFYQGSVDNGDGFFSSGMKLQFWNGSSWVNS
jgi:hypothetical protein